MLEITERVTLKNEVEKLRKTLEKLRQLVGRNHLKPFLVIHYKSISPMDSKRLRSEKVNSYPIFTMKCDRKLKDVLPFEELTVQRETVDEVHCDSVSGGYLERMRTLASENVR